MVSKACVVGIYQRKLELIAQQGIEMLVLVPPFWRDERGDTHLERVYTDGYRLEVMPIRFNGNFHLHHYPRLRERILNFRPHIVHIDEEPYNAACWQALYHARSAGARTLFFSWQNINRQYPVPFRWGERWVLSNVDYALAGTGSAAAVWRQKGYTGPIDIIPQFGTDPALFTASDGQEEANRPFTIGYAGRLVEEKGVQVLMQAATHLQSIDWRLYLLGGGPYQAQLESLAKRLGIFDRVIFAGQVRSVDMPAQYRRFDVLVVPSLTRINWKEQFGRVLVEAMASGVPVIGSDSGAIPDVIGDAGLIVPEGDAAALAACLTNLQSDTALRAHLIMMGRDRVLTQFTHEKIALDTVQVYKKMLSS